MKKANVNQTKERQPRHGINCLKLYFGFLLPSFARLRSLGGLWVFFSLLCSGDRFTFSIAAGQSSLMAFLLLL